MNKYYVVLNGRVPGIYNTWTECNQQVFKYKNAKYKGFKLLNQAEEYYNTKTIYKMQQNNTISVDNSDNNKLDDNLNDKSDILDKTNETIQYIYTDGACSNNGRKNAKAGYGVYISENNPNNISERVVGKQTNNTAEVLAIIKALELIKRNIKIETTKYAGNNNINQDITQWVIVTDSKYALRYATTLGEKYNKENWKTDIPNKELVKQLYLLTQYVKKYKNVEFQKVEAHTGKQDKHSLGNEQADKLARLAIGCTRCCNDNSQKIYLNISYEKKEIAKNNGCKWDRNKKKWWTTKKNPKITYLLSI